MKPHQVAAKSANKRPKERAEVAVGYDLGTTSSCASVLRNGNLVTIPNELGEPTTPSYVRVTADREVTVGRVAKETSDGNPQWILHDSKRLLGKSQDHPSVQRDLKYWPFRVANVAGVPLFRVGEARYFPEQISAKILLRLKMCAEDFLGDSMSNKSVITVPAYFNDSQRQATKDAGELAGLEVLRIINEPTAAALAFMHRHGGDTEGQTILVFDLGGGTFDISLMTLEAGTLKVIAVGGDSHLGGRDFDHNLMDYVLREFREQSGLDLDQYQAGKKREKLDRLKRRLALECERQKEFLASARSVTINLENALDGRSLKVTITRDKFNELNEEYFKRCIGIMDQVLAGHSTPKDDVDLVVLVGGSTRIRKIREMLQKYFGRPPSCVLNASEAVAEGAAILAAILAAHLANSTAIVTADGREVSIDLRDVQPISLGFSGIDSGTNRPRFFRVIPMNTPIPCAREITAMLGFDAPGHILLAVMEGEHEDPDRNWPLGEFVVRNLPEHLEKNVNFKVQFEVNADGILSVVVTFPNYAKENRFVLDSNRNRLSPEQVRHLRDVDDSLEEIVTFDALTRN